MNSHLRKLAALFLAMMILPTWAQTQKPLKAENKVRNKTQAMAPSAEPANPKVEAALKLPCTVSEVNLWNKRTCSEALSWSEDINLSLLASDIERILAEWSKHWNGRPYVTGTLTLEKSQVRDRELNVQGHFRMYFAESKQPNFPVGLDVLEMSASLAAKGGNVYLDSLCRIYPKYRNKSDSDEKIYDCLYTHGQYRSFEQAIISWLDGRRGPSYGAALVSGDSGTSPETPGRQRNCRKDYSYGTPGMVGYANDGQGRRGIPTEVCD